MKIQALLLVFILMFSFASADTFILGNVHKSNPSDFVSGATVVVTCGANSLSTPSNSDGSYGVGFEVSDCPDGSAVSISASKDGYSGSDSANINNKNDTDYFTIKNIKLSLTPCTGCACPGACGGGGGGSSRYYNCGNGVCDSGETNSLCPQDCKVQNLTPVTPAVLNENKSVETSTEVVPNTPQPGFLSGITGAVTGLAGKPVFWVAIVFVIVVVGGFIIIRRKGTKKSADSKEQKKDK
jgi:hypothetical protein